MYSAQLSYGDLVAALLILSIVGGGHLGWVHGHPYTRLKPYLLPTGIAMVSGAFLLSTIIGRTDAFIISALLAIISYYVAYFGIRR